MKIATSILSLSIILGLSSNSWLFLWLMLEFNAPMFSMILIFNNENPLSPLNYFLMQSLPSMFLIMILTSILSLTSNSSTYMMNNPLMIVAFMKMGLAPLHNWMILILKKLKNTSISMLLTIQKILPLKITMLLKLTTLLSSILIFNLLLSNLLMTMSNKTNSILMASSMFNMTWILFNMNLSTKMSSIYFLIYCLITLPLIKYLMLSNIKSINYSNKKTFLNLIMIILAISGMPPLWGFMNKYILILTMTTFNTPKLMILLLLSSSIIMLNNYLKLIFSILMKNLKNKSLLKIQPTWNILFNITAPSALILL